VASYYASWKEELHTCRACGWKGTGEQCRFREMYRELFEICCPSCGREVWIVMFPTIEERRQNWDKVSEEDKKSIEFIEAHQKDFAARSLKSPEQLPDIEGDSLVFTWDIGDGRHGGDTLLKYDGEIIWREPALYDCYERFAEVADILKRKYGKRIQDLMPTPKSHLYLYGDRLSSLDHVEEVRKALLDGS
jgi:hypothetical protein